MIDKSKELTKRGKPRFYGIEVPNLRAWRFYRMLNQHQLALRAGMSHHNLNKIEHGKTASFDSVRKLAAALDLTPDELRYELPPQKQPARAMPK